ncbi:hypothetical protein [Sphingopyxis alaskensis]|uniref:Uncharacterized protein n=1 Tax=Sphingopyxis alaskensis (strain DSM 13593 / LMG 18877 / RB2256) TaxID=317655 RepID=Q1GX40_SPHAL|nr:hypothetical protein [Sphingopyxis alaskensis]ABF51782.1 hypothetical protein Sala_0056 [Sphingopyxis alaskensis RB2256]
MKNINPNLGRLAEDYIVSGAWDPELVDKLGPDELDQLFSHLTARAAVETAAATLEPESLELDEDAQAAVLRLQSFYLGEVARVRTAKPDAAAMLLKPATWLAIEPVLRDRDFLIRLAQRRLRGMQSRCTQDIADLLGYSRRAVADFFRGEAGEGLTLAENRNTGKPDDGGDEEFSTALARSDIPEAFKRRWREE